MKSVLEADNINYKKKYSIDEEDIDYDTIIYNYEHDGVELEIALGKLKYTYIDQGVVHCSIYMIVNDTPVSRIGIFEIRESEILNSIDDNGLDMSVGNILIFASTKYLRKNLNLNEKSQPIVIDDLNQTDEPGIKHDIIELTDDVLRVEIDENMMTPVSTDALKTLQSGVFIENTKIIAPSMLQEESVLDVEEIAAEYKESSKNTWIEQFTHNNNYSILENEGSGDCFFAVIRDAFRQIGKETTVNKLRSILSKEITRDIYNEYRTLYTNFMAEFQSIESEMTAIRKTTNELKRRITKVTNKPDHNNLVIEANELTTRYKKLGEDRTITKDLLKEFLYMQNITEFEQFQEFILTPNYWADNWAISTLERVLNIKLIILDENAYNVGDVDSVMLCGPVHKDNDTIKNFSPDYYIMTSYTGNHYRLITYKDKYIFRFREVPFNIKSLIVNKCLERSSGIYYLVQDLRNYKTNLGLEADYGEPIKDEDDFLNKNLYDSDVVFVFHSQSNSSPNAGKGVGEHIDPEHITKYRDLNTKKTNAPLYNWRRKLDDTWGAPFTVDGHRWQSVRHYLLGSQYKKGFPDFYLQFSLDSESQISTNLEMANDAASKSGKHNGHKLRPDNVTVDADFYSSEKFPRNEEERYKALDAKFTQNMDLNKVLMITNRAKLQRFVRRKDSIIDMMLMKIRKDIA